MNGNRELVSVVALVLTVACVKRATPTVEPPIALGSVDGVVEAKIGFREGDHCSIDPIGVEFPLAAADGSKVVLMGRYDSFFQDDTDVRVQGLWRLGPGQSSMFGVYMEDEAIMLIDWLGVDVSTCRAAESLAASAVAEANAYLASKHWFPMKEVEDFDYHIHPDPGLEDHYSCVPGTQLDLCASVAGFSGVLHNGDWISHLDTWLYVSLRACLAVAVQYKQSEGPWESTAIEVFDISGIVAALPPEHAVECGAARAAGARSVVSPSIAPEST